MGRVLHFSSARNWQFLSLRAAELRSIKRNCRVGRPYDDIALTDEDAQAIANGKGEPKPEPSVDPDNLDHPEELSGE
jgi:hypothetical protein